MPTKAASAAALLCHVYVNRYGIRSATKISEINELALIGAIKLISFAAAAKKCISGRVQSANNGPQVTAHEVVPSADRTADAMVTKGSLEGNRRASVLAALKSAAPRAGESVRATTAA